MVRLTELSRLILSVLSKLAVLLIQSGLYIRYILTCLSILCILERRSLIGYSGDRLNRLYTLYTGSSRLNVLFSTRSSGGIFRGCVRYGRNRYRILQIAEIALTFIVCGNFACCRTAAVFLTGSHIFIKVIFHKTSV